MILSKALSVKQYPAEIFLNFKHFFFSNLLTRSEKDSVLIVWGLPEDLQIINTNYRCKAYALSGLYCLLHYKIEACGDTFFILCSDSLNSPVSDSDFLSTLLLLLSSLLHTFRFWFACGQLTTLMQ